MGARDRLIDSAIALMRCNGIAGTGIAQLLDHSGISRRSIYLNFPGGKSELVAEATRAAGQASSALMRTILDSTDLASAIAAFPGMWRETLVSTDFTAGCPIVAAALGRSESPEAADVAGETFTEWEDILATRLEAEQVSSSTARTLATTIVAAVEGAVIMSLATRSTAPLERAGKQMADLVALHTGRTSVA
ncbi:TetR/AcrR family transcriptional regulator [Nocardia seriolae]|uniref:HTH-type transcriptional regulator n=1 Tax=Nocardia seriolae TaxID=37332 RepID=A0A0B8NB71_9NOCA|nr:TetR/AcrR family transcriptional regulator [Nocardia seriolae]APB00801.1 putative HTH-type transcriptional regulator [Nocardia seriolae]MTJ65359.1 TetR family transcriptional regulator [Nocardia seriolae]MTJ71874.1 TetR family transcriptional regulator [Nocardia seriolae]MTJ90245.1 TetR family transcriptional regulator [Nocardia seriolae]MTK34208.1 TetR family transcriptional regulator [Nocardia seriolae]